jgi:hypothetical protein
MRGNDGGGGKIDYAIELVAQAARISAAGGDRLGLVAFDSRVVASVPPGSDPAHGRTLIGTAIDLRSIVDEDLTDVDDEQLVNTVARYFREQEGIDALRGTNPQEARRRLAELAARSVKNDPVMRQPVGARDPLSRVLRAFCRARALPLPLKHDPTGAAKLAGLAAALRHAVAGARETRTVIIISDLDPISDVSGLKSAIAFARQKHHRVTVVAPSGEDFLRRAARPPPGDDRPAPPPGELQNAMRSLFTGDEASRLRELRPALSAMGVPLYLARAHDPAARWLRRAASPHVR